MLTKKQVIFPQLNNCTLTFFFSENFNTNLKEVDCKGTLVPYRFEPMIRELSESISFPKILKIPISYYLDVNFR